MGARINFDQRVLDKVLHDAVRETARKAQPELDRLPRSHGGRPVAEIQPRLKALFDKYGLEPSDPRTIRSYAEQLAEGTRIVLQP